MLFEYLATEIVTTIFLHCSTVQDVTSLSQSCHRFRKIANGPAKLRILKGAVENQYGPLEDAVQLITHNASQPAHVIRDVPFSLAVLNQVIRVGKVAEKWADIYPFKKWKSDFTSRRLLTAEERYRARRALYRLWLYSKAFHNEAFNRQQRMTLANMQLRSELLHNWNTQELAEMLDLQGIVRDVVTYNVCPSNGTIARKFRKRFAETEYSQHQLLFNIHLNYPPPPNPAFAAPLRPLSDYHCPPSAFHPTPAQYYTSTTVNNYKNRLQSRYAFTPTHDPGFEGWGEDTDHYYVVEDMLKLDPEQVLWLKQHAPLKYEVEAYTRSLGEWFNNNGETWAQTFQWVIRARGEDLIGLLDGLCKEEVGIAVRDD